MPNKFQIIQGAVTVLALAWGIKERIESRKTVELYLEGAQAYEEVQQANEAQISYLCHMLDEHDVPVDEFDLIALNYHQ